MHIEETGTNGIRRFRLVHQGMVWTGSGWADRSEPGLLYASQPEAMAEWDRLKDRYFFADKIVVYTVPFQFGIISAYPYDVEAAKKTLANSIFFHVPEKVSLPSSAIITHFRLCWESMSRLSLCGHKQPTFKKGEAHHRDFVVPVRIGIYADDENDLDAIRLAIEDRIKVTCEELLDDVPVTHLEIDWKDIKEIGGRHAR